MQTYFSKNIYDLKIHLYLFVFNLLVTSLIFYYYSDELIYILIKPLFLFHTENYLIFTEITELFFIKLNLTIIFGLIITILLNIIQFWLFFAPGIYKLTNIKFFIWLLLTYIIGYISFNFIFLKIIPNIWSFFLLWGSNDYQFLYNIYLEPNITLYIQLIIKFLLIMTYFFQYPLILYILVHKNKVFFKHLIKKRKIFYLVIFIVSAILSPPDIFSQGILSLVIISLFELVFLTLFILFEYA